MAAAAVVLLAAHFEEYVRQQIEEYAKAVVASYEYLPDDFKQKLIENYWKSGTAKLERIRPKVSPLWSNIARPLLTSLVEFPINENTLHFEASYLCHHEQNMRWDTLSALCSRVGIKSLKDQLFKHQGLRRLIGTASKNEFGNNVERRVNEFYELRNGIVHSISQNTGVGSTIFRSWSEFFRVFTTAFAGSLEGYQQSFLQSIGRL